MSRKDAINALFLKKPDSAALPSARSSERVRTGAVAAMGASLQELSETAQAAECLMQQLATDERVIALEPGLIDGSTIADRIPIDVDPGFDQLVISIAENGQQVPVLVRPHPHTSGRYQIVYGRRRLRAAEHLGLPVKAIVRSLSDSELIIAQGRENLDRQDLSFIEKALFAKSLEDSGCDRHTITAALSTDKADLSRFISVARQIPEDLIRAIGPAPKTGRSRWLGLAKKLTDPECLSTAHTVLKESSLQSLVSDQRFQALWNRLVAKPALNEQAELWKTPHGICAGNIEREKGRTRITFDEAVVPDFATFVSSRLEALFEEFSRTNPGDADD
ncbi:plasmid partitioning protein RepB [Castellaniella sp.]|uniref:plasmid partitioning protein RepB n=1 Tax=Castellaniella sp. TaxID=1955812 RepID=UPI002AFE8B0A|nr:plasmid partitioning protein RepB [Castellaniella sp.]